MDHSVDSRVLFHASESNRRTQSPQPALLRRKARWIEQSLVRLRTDSSRGELDAKSSAFGALYHRTSERTIHHF
jgi:hypothetical protein